MKKQKAKPNSHANLILLLFSFFYINQVYASSTENSYLDISFYLKKELSIEENRVKIKEFKIKDLSLKTLNQLNSLAFQSQIDKKSFIFLKTISEEIFFIKGINNNIITTENIKTKEHTNTTLEKASLKKFKSYLKVHY